MRKGDKGKKVLGLILIVLLILMFLGSIFSGVVAATTYDPQAAVNYADTWWNGRNPNYHAYSNEGGDCATLQWNSVSNSNADKYLYDMRIATGQSVGYYEPNQTQLDSKLHNIEVPNQQPTAIIDSITPNPAEQGTDTVSFTGHGTDPDGTVVAYNWSSSIDGPLSTSAAFSKAASELSVGTHTFYFKVQDNDGTWSSEDTADLTIYPANVAPTAIIDFITPDPAVQGTDTVSFSGHGTDTDGTVVAYNWSSSIDGPLSTSAAFTKPASELSVGTHTIYFKVQDDNGAWSTEDTEDLTIYPGPELSYSPESHDFCDMCEGKTDSTTFDIWNSETGTLTYSLSDTCDWLEAHPTSGSSTEGHNTITVDIDTTGLSEGTHTGNIKINSNEGSGTFTVMVNVMPCPCGNMGVNPYIDSETWKEWVAIHNSLPEAYISPEIKRKLEKTPIGSCNLLGHLDYDAMDRNQDKCGNCWVWAGTGVLGIALDVQERIKDRLSVQYFSSCWPGVFNRDCACCGGSPSEFADWIRSQGYVIPWSNTNADWQDGDRVCIFSSDCTATNVPCESISTSIIYPISSCTLERIETHGVGNKAAIANIKNVLEQDKAIFWAFALPNNEDWGEFTLDWHNLPEDDIWDPDFACGHEWDDKFGGAHAVLCVGYNNVDPNNAYWIMLNSWGATARRPNGLFHVDMDMNYDCYFTDGGYATQLWEPIDVSFDIPRSIIILSPTQSSPASAGAFDNPSHIDATIEVTEGATPVTGLTNADFTFKIGSKTATASLTDTSIPGTYVFDLTPPTQDAAGKYDLVVTLTYNGHTLEDTEKEAIIYTDAVTNVDLTVSSVNAPTSAQAGSSIAVSWTVNNQGNAASGAFNNRISLATTTNPYGTDILLGNYPMNSIAAGSSSSDAQVPQIPETVSPGYYYVTVFADASNDVPDESDENNNINKAPNQIHITPYEEPDVPLTGDMNGDDTDTTGIYNPNTAEFTFNGKTVRFGEVNDEPIIGDWDDDGRDEIGVFRLREGGADQSTFHLVGRNWAELPPGDVGAADKEISFPYYAGNIPVAGDWDGDGDDDIGSYYPHDCTFYLYLLDWDASTATFYTPVSFGEPGDMPLTGDWNCDGYEDVAVYRKYDPDYNQNLVFYFDLDLTGDQHEIGPYEWGDNHHIPIAGRWEDDDGDKVGVYDPNTEKFERNNEIPPPCTCGNMGVNPTSWSPPTLNCGESNSQIVTVSASGAMVRGVTVSMVSVPTWLSVSPTNLRDLSSGSSKTFTITASPTASLSAGTRGDFAYTVRVSNTCGSPSTIDVSGTIHVDCIEPSQPPSYSNPSVSPGFGTPSTQFDYSVDVSDPDGDTVTVTLKTYDPSDGSWEDQGNRNVVGSGTASWNDLTPFEVDDRGQTGKYTFVFDEGYNSGEWGPFYGPAIETDAAFSNWDYPSTSMATEKIPVEVDISNPHGVKSAWLHYDYGDDGSEDGVTQMSLISVRGAKTEIRGGSSSGLGVEAQKIAVSESAPLSGGGGSGVAEREGIPKSIYLYDAKTCKDVEDSDPYDPIGVTTVFSPTDSVSYTWLQFNDIWSSHTVKWEWYAPNGNFYTDSTLLIQDPSDSGYYEWYKCWGGIYINGHPAAEEEGIWTVKVYLDGGHIETLYFNIEYIIADYTMCKNVQASSPQDPIERTSTFLADDEKAVSWLRLDDVTNSLNVRWDWYDPLGNPYYTWDIDTSDPADEGYDYWDWVKAWCYIPIKDYAAAEKPGLWVVKVYIWGEYVCEEEFTIYPDDARYKCEIPAPGMGYAGDEVSFYVSAYSAYDSSTDSAKHLVDIYVPDDPTLSIFPSSHDFGDKCERVTDSTTFELWNSGTGTLTYILIESCGWVDVNPTGGSSTEEHDTITVDIDTTGLAEGPHTCDISISSNGGSGTFTVRVNIVPKQDLIITEKWLCWPDNCTICYNVTNIGTGTAPACHNTALYVDDEEVAHDHVPVDLAPGESYTGCFNGFVWTYTPPSDDITVCADNNESIVELDEDNNCLTNIWMCGDVNCDGKVTMSDVRKVFNRYLDPSYPLDLPWAADVNGDGKVTMSDVRKVFNRYLDPGYGLECCCEDWLPCP